jgi:hypothetical protein
MTDQHPLTDEIIDTFASPQYNSFVGIGDVDCGFTYDDLRAAADWQLDQVIQAWEQYLEEPGTYTQAIRCFDQKLKAMRPTTTQEDNSD